MSVGIKVKNNFGYYTINSDYQNTQLMIEESVNDGLSVIPIQRIGVPIVAVKDGAGLIKEVTVINGFCESIAIYTISFANVTKIRIYSYPEKNNKSSYGLSVHTGNGLLAYTSLIDTMKIINSSYIEQNYNDRDPNGNFTDPAGWKNIGNIDIGVRGPCPIIYYQSLSVYTGSWLILGTGICETGGSSDFNMGGAPIANHGNSTPALGLYERNIKMALNNDLVVSHHNYNSQNYGTWFYAFFNIHMNIITLDD